MRNRRGLSASTYRITSNQRPSFFLTPLSKLGNVNKCPLLVNAPCRNGMFLRNCGENKELAMIKCLCLLEIFSTIFLPRY